MVRKIFIILLFSTLLISNIFLYNFFTDLHYVSTFKSFVVPKLKIPLSVLDNYNNSDNSLSKKASQEIILTSLENMGYTHWKEYLEYIELKVYIGDVLPDNEKELIVVLNLSKDLAAIAIYTPMDQEFVFKTSLKDILPVKELNFLRIPNESYSFIVTEQLLDERFGAFFIDQFLEIYLFEDNTFKSVFKKSKFLQEVYNLKWIDPNASSDQWAKIVENNSITINQNDKLRIDVSTYRVKQEALSQFIPEESNYKTVQEIVTNESYYWSPKYSHFVISEGTDRISASEVAIIQDTSLWRESFLGLKSNNYQIKTIEGEVLFLDKKSIILNTDYEEGL